MNISVANTDASLRFHRSHERLNLTLKVQMLGLGLLADEIDSKRPAIDLKKALYRRKGWLWGGMPDWSNPNAIVSGARCDIGQAGVVRAFSAFDLFIDEIAADLDRWIAFSHQVSMSEDGKDSEEPDRAARFYTKIGANPVAVRFLWPVYRYFRFARDCIVHRDGIASNALEEIYRDPKLKSALLIWKKKTGEKTSPELVPIKAGQLIDLNHRQALSASSILRTIALDINQQALQRLGVLGLVYLVTRRIFFEETPTDDVVRQESMLKALNFALANRYRVGSFEKGEAARVLRTLGITKQCSARFRRIKEVGVSKEKSSTR